MTDTSTIIEFDRFRRLREALSAFKPQPQAKEADPDVVDWYLPGFLGKARISTAFGDLPIEALRVRDDIRTYSGATARVQMIDKIHLDEDFLRKHPSALPIQIPANSFGPGRPTNDVFVSPGQEICPDAHVASTFIKSRALKGRFIYSPVHYSGLTYYRFHCGEPAIVRIEGIWVRVQP
jgi:hypothetical protein